MRLKSVSSSASNSFCADSLISRSYLVMRKAASQTSGAVSLVRNALFLSAILGNEPVPKILPDRAMPLQVDLHSHAIAFLVGYESNTSRQCLCFWHCLCRST